MAKKERDYTEHYALARQKAKELGYNNLSMLDLEGTEEDKMKIREIYRQPLPQQEWYYE